MGGTVAGWGEGQEGRCWHTGQGGQGAGPGRAGQHSLPWHRGPKAPGAQSSQAVPVKRAWHLHSPLPLMPSMHMPRWLQGLLAPPGQARGGGEERGEVRGLVRSPAHAPLAWTHSILHPVAAEAPAQAAPVPWRTPGPLAQSTRTLPPTQPPPLRTLSCGSTHPSLTTPSPFLRFSGQSCAPGRLGGWEGRSAESAASGHSPRHSLP